MPPPEMTLQPSIDVQTLRYDDGFAALTGLMYAVHAFIKPLEAQSNTEYRASFLLRHPGGIPLPVGCGCASKMTAR